MKHWTHAALAILALSTAAYAATPPKGGDQMASTMDKPTPKTYEGCVAAGPTAGTFVLNHAAEAAMGKDAMAKDSMKDTPASGAMGKDAMAPSKTLALEGKAVDFSKHVGHQVSVTGTEVPAMAVAKPDAMAPMGGADTMAKKDPPARKFTVTAFKMIATSCKM